MPADSALAEFAGRWQERGVLRWLVIIVASVALFAAGFFLWQMTRDTSDDKVAASTPKRDAQPRAAVERTSTDVAAPSQRDARVAPVGSPMRRAPSAPSANDPWAAGPAPAAAPVDPAEVKRIETRGWLKGQMVATEQQVVECLEKAGKDGAKLDGVVAFPFSVSRKNGKVVTESGNVDYTTVGSVEVVECMAGVMKKINYDELPEGAATVTSYRKITVKDGAVVEDWLGPHETADQGSTKP